MRSFRLVFVVSALAMLAVMSLPASVTSQKAPPCADSQTAPKSEKQEKLDACACEQSVATDKPTYRVGKAPFGWKNAIRVGAGATVGRGGAKATAKPKEMYEGMELPAKPELPTPEVVRLKERVLKARENRVKELEAEWAKLHKILELEPDHYMANELLKSRRVNAERERFLSLQSTEAWVAKPKFDWRATGLDVGPVLYQGECDSCWAFVAMSVYQSSWNLEQVRLGIEFSEAMFPVDYRYQRLPSIQQLLNCMSDDDGSCGGGWHGTAFHFMVTRHVPHIPDRLVWNKGEKVKIEEYTGRKSRCTDILRMVTVQRGGLDNLLLDGPDSRPRLPPNSDTIGTAFDRALAWGYVNEKKPDELPTVAQLKQALVEHGPIAAPLYGDRCFSVYKEGVFNGRNNGIPTHVVVLIGWDDEKQAWLIKNSWGERWGEKGYAWVAYGSNNIGLYAAWIQPSPSTEVP
jgi:hypothetical protein